MDTKTAEIIARKSRALKHCEKILGQCDKKGTHRVILNNTGVVIPVTKNDAIYLRIQSIKYQLIDELHSYKVSQSVASSSIKRTAPAPVGASAEKHVLAPEEKLERRRAQMREASRRYQAKKKALKNS
ncbi:MAG: hypothetical protein ACI4M6_05670 [Christensenellaceae bacterium]